MPKIDKLKTVKPFLKWAGGKGQLLHKLSKFYPMQLYCGEVEMYVEPFVGGGAVFFDVMQKFEIKQAVIIDINKELINCYRCIKVNVKNLIEELNMLQSTYSKLDEIKQSELFYRVRNRYNLATIENEMDYKKAADFIFLNRTCFNGLYRVNSKGAFNVPFGKYKNPKICDEENLMQIHKLLQRVRILDGDYKQCNAYVSDKAFVYFDPPYRPITMTQSFVGYSKHGFSDNDQIELAQFSEQLTKKGCQVLLSNSDPKNTDEYDNFFDELYKRFNVSRVNAKRMINCHADKRGGVTEIVVSNYEWGGVI
ncbi:MAG: DNA adenine methylase [Clostridiales bacterium]|nr:DNA adenine methylase [Clostridiales bacterium]